jgi:tRNA-2-methylthio-N6-dimethylallyladenosine synthase
MNAARRRGTLVVDVSFPEIEKFDNPAAAQGRRALRLRLGDGRLQQVLHLLRGALYARRGGQPATRRRDRRIAHLAQGGVREVNLLGQNVNAYRGAITRVRLSISPNCCTLSRRIPGIGAHSLHHLAPGGIPTR